MSKIIEDDLRRVKVWAEDKIAQGQEPPWAFKHYTDLVVLLNAIMASQAATISLEDSLQLQEQRAPAPPLPAGIRHIDTARRRRVAIPVRLPM
jgi:hypothetical protein